MERNRESYLVFVNEATDYFEDLDKRFEMRDVGWEVCSFACASSHRRSTYFIIGC